MFAGSPRLWLSALIFISFRKCLSEFTLGAASLLSSLRVCTHFVYTCEIRAGGGGGPGASEIVYNVQSGRNNCVIFKG